MLTKNKDKESSGNERKSSSSSSSHCEVGLGLMMHSQPSDSFSCDGTPVSSSHHMYGGLLQRGFHNTGGMPVSGKALFTASQWQELERQKTIHKYIIASIPVPPQLLLPSSRSPSLSQCNTSDLRFSASGIDPEPWRCKRTDGKKWRCSRDVAPQQKYCERHAHKNKPRSRKLVDNTTPYSSHKVPLHSNTSSLSSPPPTSFDQTRCIEWFMGSGSDAHKQKQQQQWEQLIRTSLSSSSSRMDLNKDYNNDKNTPAYHPHFDEDKQGFITMNPYMSETYNSTSTQMTRHFFVDAWEKEGFDTSLIHKEFPASPSSPPLTLSMSHDYRKGGSSGILRPECMTPVPWMNPPGAPGGPLGEVLCLGGSSSCSSEGGSHALNFIG